MTDEMKKKFEEMKKLEHDIKGKLEAFRKENGITDGVAEKSAYQKEHLEEMKADMLKKMDELKSLVPVSKNMVFGGDAELKENEERVSLGKFLLMLKNHDPRVMKTVMSEGTDAQGGYLVPTYYSNKILGILANVATVVNKCQSFTQLSDSQKIPKWLTNITVSGVAEATRRTTTKPTFSQKTSTLKNAYALTTLTDELLSDESSNLVSELDKKVAEAMALYDENLILVGDANGSDDFDGITNTSGIKEVAQDGVSLGYKDIKNIWANPNVLSSYKTNAEWYFNETVLGLIMDIVDNNGRPLWNLGSLDGSVPSQILGKRYNLSSKILNNYGAGDESKIIYGDFKNVILGKKANAGITVKISDSAVLTDGAGAVTESMFELGQVAYRWGKRGSVVVANPEAFSVGTGIK